MGVAFVIALLLVALAELGDKAQLMTIPIAADPAAALLMLPSVSLRNGS